MMVARPGALCADRATERAEAGRRSRGHSQRRDRGGRRGLLRVAGGLRPPTGSREGPFTSASEGAVGSSTAWHSA